MSCFKMTVPCNLTHHGSMATRIYVSPIKFSPLPKTIPKLSTHMKVSPKLMSQKRNTIVCLFGSKDNSKSDSGNEGWKNPLENVMGSLKKEPSLEDLLREQMKKQEFVDDGGSGGGVGGGGGGGGGGEGGGIGDSDDEGLSGILEEFMNVIFATCGFIFLYVYIINGEDINRFTMDILKFIFTRRKSIRLRRVMDQWRGYFERLGEEKEVDEFWLEREILNTNTWWDSPKKLRDNLRRSRPY